nr:MAG TPA: hypothetical protein [Caudoviricetes sp.]
MRWFTPAMHYCIEQTISNPSALSVRGISVSF